MATTVKVGAMKDAFIDVDGSRIRYIEQGEGPVVLLLHGASLGSAADVFLRNMEPLASAGFRVIALDQPGFGLSDVPADHSPLYRRKAIAKFVEALGLSNVALVGHSQAGAAAMLLALESPARYTHLIILGTAGLLPPLEVTQTGDREGAVQQRLERRMSTAEPTLEDTLKLLEANLFHHELITPEELALRHSRSVGSCFTAFVARSQDVESASAKPKSPSRPLWQRLDELKVPLLMIYGKNDRANAFERASLLKKQRPDLQIHIADNCKHLVPWDAADLFHRLSVEFLKA